MRIEDAHVSPFLSRLRALAAKVNSSIIFRLRRLSDTISAVVAVHLSRSSSKHMNSIKSQIRLAVYCCCLVALPILAQGDHRTELLKRLADVQNCGEECMWSIADTLGKPQNKTFLLSAFQGSPSNNEKLGIIYALYRIDDPEVTDFFRRLVAEKYDDGEELYYPLNYLAKRCETDALRILSGNGKGGYKGEPGCLQWAKTVELFGKCKYRPAIPYLINSIQAACMNIGVAAVDDLREIYPGSPSFKDSSLEQIEQYFRKRVAAESSAK